MPGNIVPDLSGQQFNDWLVLARAPQRKGADRSAFWLCRCKCGTERSVRGGGLRSGHSKNCGCGRAKSLTDRITVHGQSRSRTYAIWQAMRNRCHRENSTAYEYYGARGITVCERWRGPSGFPNFLADMGERPSSKHSLDRIDNDGNYEPGNCRWALKATQNRNRRDTVFLTVDGNKVCETDVARMCCVHSSTVMRLRKLGMTGDEIVAKYRDRKPKERMPHPCA